MPGRALLRAWLLALALLPAGGAAAALADDGRPPGPEEVGHPPTSVPVPISGLRPSEIETHAFPTPSSPPGTTDVRDLPRAVNSRKELVLFVGGYGSQADDGAFTALSARFPADRYDVRRLGDDQRFPYDTYGPLDASASALTDEIRALAPRYTGVNIVSHSMGGAVVDRAFGDGLSAKDGVRTYVSIAGPHSGADFARVPSAVLPLIGPVRDIVRAGAALVARDPDSAAARDLATARPIAPPQGVVRLDLSLSTDGFVNRYDAIDPGVDQRVFLPASPGEFLDGHGGSLTNREIGEVVVETIREHRLPPDRRDGITRVVAPLLWDRSTSVWRFILLVTVVGAIALWLARFIPGWRELIDRADALGGVILRSIGR
ncbi:MAG: hypothetical protein AUH33_04430 [Chloroflexi bacterium 13_1_40CM_68_21]|nr:MAG: hypothetical protein AUH33_04430 [Chloroflexi bacterium 13_1_40CM_68_21]